MAIPFIASYVSGVTLQDDDTSAVPKSYIDTISGALDSRIDTLAGAAEVTYSPLTAGVGLDEFEGVIAVSGVTAVSLDVQGYSTISSQAKSGYDYIVASGERISLFVASGDEYSAAYASGKRVIDSFDHNLYATSANIIANYVTSANALANFAGSSAFEPVKAWFVASAQALSAYQASGDEYSAAYASAQLLKEGAFRNVATGWFFASDQSAIPHTLGVKPNHVTITPSGAVTYAIAFTVDETNINLRVSHASQRTVNWRAEV